MRWISPSLQNFNDACGKPQLQDNPIPASKLVGMRSLYDFLVPVSDEEYLLLIQNIRILRNYQNEVRRNLGDLAKSVEILRAKDSLPLVQSIYAQNEGLKRTIQHRNRHQDHIQNWERSNKIHMVPTVAKGRHVDRLIKIANILGAVKNRAN